MYRANEELLDGSATRLHEGAATDVRVLPSSGAAIKRLIDLSAALLFFVIFLPLFVAVTLGVWLTSKGPVFYSQARVGRGGRSFKFYKFRSMVVNSEEVFNAFLDSDHEAREQWDRFQKLDRDPRITWFGHFIRRTSLDELPQFWNVLKGDMSIVGPRPCMPNQKQLYGQHWKSYCAVRPGLTGLWQISGRNWLTFEQRVALDSKYVKEWSMLLDFRILLKTVRVVLTGHGSK